MNWELYEVWSVDNNGYEDLIETTKSLKEAREIAANALGDDCQECIIYQEDDNGELVEIESVK